MEHRVRDRFFHSSTGRPLACFLPVDEPDAIMWFHPNLDVALVESWWNTSAFPYFEFPHADEGGPSAGRVGHLRTVDLSRWWGETLVEFGYGGRTIAIDSGAAAELGLMPGWEERPGYDFFAVAPPPPSRPCGGTFGQMASAMPEARCSWTCTASSSAIAR